MICGGEPFADRVGVVQRPCGELLQHTDLGEDVEVVELVGLVVFAEGVALGGFGDVLAARVFVEDGRSALIRRGEAQAVGERT